MKSVLALLSKDLVYDEHDITADTITIHCHVEPEPEQRIHSYYIRKVKDLNIGDKKVVLRIKAFRYYKDRKSSGKTESVELNFVDEGSNRTNRLTSYVMNQMKENSAIGLERVLRNGVADLSDSTILRMVKKKR
jgi:transposase